MKTHALLLAFLATLISGRIAYGASAGGTIVSACVGDSKMQLTFESSASCTYQVQSSLVVKSKYWPDAVPLIVTNAGLVTVSAPLRGPSAFYRILEFTNNAFWYDWTYYHQVPSLVTWGLGAPQNGYEHIDRAYEWYIDQADTGTYSGNNCGPSSVTMAIKCYDQSFNRTAADARNTYPRDGGWWYTSDIVNYLGLYSIPHSVSGFNGTNQLCGLLGAGNLLILCIDTTYLGTDFSGEHRTGRFYSFAGGHFLVVKGWRSTFNGLYFEVYDPNNWHARYADSTPKGRNRHLPGRDLSLAIQNWWNFLIVVPAGAGGGAALQSEWLAPVDPEKVPDMPGM